MTLISSYRTAMIGQYEAALQTLQQSVETCPEDLWNTPVANHPFCECVFHALFFADLYLGPDVESLKSQEFHQTHPEIFRNYEELANRPPKLLYDTNMIEKYFAFVQQKLAVVLEQETEESLALPVGFDWLDIDRAELHPYNIRHIQHHAAQLNLKLRLNAHADPRWYRSGCVQMP